MTRADPVLTSSRLANEGSTDALACRLAGLEARYDEATLKLWGLRRHCLNLEATWGRRSTRTIAARAHYESLREQCAEMLAELERLDGSAG